MGLTMMEKSHFTLLVETRESFMIAIAFKVKGEQGLNTIGKVLQEERGMIMHKGRGHT